MARSSQRKVRRPAPTRRESGGSDHLLTRLQVAAITASMDGMAILDENEVYVFVNDAHARIYGYESPEELIGRSWRILYDGSELERFEREIMPELHRVGAWRGEAVGLRKDGSRFDQELSLSTIDGDGLVCVVRDVTDRKRAEMELAETRDRALEAARLKATFLQNMSHEIRTPLSIILGYCAVLEGELPWADRSDHREMFQAIRRSGRRLTETIDGILDLSKIETGSFDLRPVPVDVGEVIDTVVEEVRLEAGQKGIRLEVEGADSGRAVLFDRHCLATALVHLVDNAIKFTERGGIQVRLLQERSEQVLEVEDTGIGIEREYLDRLFEPFSQAESGYTRSFEGTGLGLALTKRYLELNGAYLSVDSDRGRGSVFRIHLPRSLEVEAGVSTSAPGEQAAPREGNGRPGILVVEDDRDAQQFMRVLLSKRYRVFLASGGEEVRKQLDERGKDVQLVLMDLSLKGTEDGLTLTRWIRNHPRFQALPVIATTAHAFPEDEERALGAGCDAYVAKPFRQERLLSQIHRFAGT